MQIVKLLLLSALSVAVPYANGADKRSTPMSVCELIAHRDVFAGRMVTVRGLVEGGGHGAWLAAGSECHYRLVTRGVSWPNIISLAYPDNRSRIESDRADFKIDWKSIRKAELEVRHSAFNRDTDRLVETYTGLFVTYPDLDRRVSPGLPGAPTFGFGHLGAAPAQLLIKSVRDVTVVHGPAR